MKYVMSDIHGRYDKYADMLELIHFSEEDELYILGDVIDRGPDGIKILMDIMNRSNVHMVLGNHELMAIQTMIAETENEVIENLDLWMWNGGGNTYKDLVDLSEEKISEIVLFLLELPSFMEIEVKNRKFYLVHGFVGDTEEERVWNRPKLDTPNPLEDKTLIVGHTPVALFYGKSNRKILDYGRTLAARGEHLKIEHAEGFIDIDCGCGGDIPGARLACLRLDDMEEFYV